MRSGVTENDGLAELIGHRYSLAQAFHRTALDGGRTLMSEYDKAIEVLDTLWPFRLPRLP